GMRMCTFRWFFCSALLASLGCTQANPGFDVLDASNLPQPIFDNSSTKKTIQSRTGSEKPTISGTCDFKIRGITAQIVTVDSVPGTVDHVAGNTPSVTCQTDGKFSFQLKSLTGLGFALTEDQTYEIQLRALTSAGVSKPSSLFVHYS